MVRTGTTGVAHNYHAVTLLHGQQIAGSTGAQFYVEPRFSMTGTPSHILLIRMLTIRQAAQAVSWAWRGLCFPTGPEKSSKKAALKQAVHQIFLPCCARPASCAYCHPV